MTVGSPRQLSFPRYAQAVIIGGGLVARGPCGIALEKWRFAANRFKLFRALFGALCASDHRPADFCLGRQLAGFFVSLVSLPVCVD